MVQHGGSLAERMGHAHIDPSPHDGRSIGTGS
jgi:hypothetical protein